MEWFSIPRQRVSAIIGVILSGYLIVLGLSIRPSDNHWLNRLDFLFYDTRFNASLALTPAKESEQSVVILDIDEKSLAEEGRWPWSRHKLADLVELLAEYGAVVVAFDVVFSEPERNAVKEVQSYLKANDVLWRPPEDWQVLADGDRNFSQKIPNMDVVLGFFFQDEENVQVGELPKGVYDIPTEQRSSLVSISKPGYAANLSTLQQAASGGGFVSTFSDPDGVIRRSPLVIRYGNELYPSLGLATVMNYLFINEIELQTTPLGSVDVMTAINVAGQSARTDVNGQVIVPYRGGKESYKYLSVTDVLQKKVDPLLLEGAIVLVGTSAIGLADLRATPVGTQYPGVEVHANIIHSLLAGDFPYRPEWEAGATFSLLVLIGALLSLWLPRLGPVAAILVSGSTLLLVVTSNFYLWHVFRLDLPMASTFLLVLALTLLNLAYGYLRENASKRLLKGMFNQYVPKAHIDRMLADPEAYQFSGDSKELTVLFSDIRSFTSISEDLSAAELKSMLNQYFTPITKVIFDHDGTIDKYVGDMVMAFWGAPIDDEQHASKSVIAALEMQKVTTMLRDDFKARGLPEVHIGVGLNTGTMNVGDMGSSYRRAYTVLGDAVNLGSRLESITKFYGAKILVGESTFAQCPDIAFQFMDRIQVKGKDEPVSIYEPLCRFSDLKEEQEKEIEDFHTMYELYIQQKWDEAIQKIYVMKKRYGEKLIFDVYLERISNLRQQTLPQDWDGVFRHTSK